MAQTTEAEQASEVTPNQEDEDMEERHIGEPLDPDYLAKLNQEAE